MEAMLGGADEALSKYLRAERVEGRDDADAEPKYDWVTVTDEACEESVRSVSVLGLERASGETFLPFGRLCAGEGSRDGDAGCDCGCVSSGGC
jgi:hypothetical protein